MILTAVVFLLILSVLVLVHEFGHFIVGRLAGVGVLEFALGLPFTRPLVSWRLKSGMKLSIYPLLFGGFVKLLGEEGPDSKEPGVVGKHFYSVGVWPRIAVVVAGVTMNFLLAVAAFYVFLAASNFKVLIPKLADYHFVSPSENLVVVTGVVADSPAKKAGLVFGDLIYLADGQHFSDLAGFQKYTAAHAGQEINLTVYDETFTTSRVVTVVPRKDPPHGQGPLGLGIGDGVVLNFKTGIEKALSGLTYSVDMLFYSLKVLAGLIFHAYQTGDTAAVTENVSGPVGIAKVVGDIISFGGTEAVKGLINLLGLLSISLAFMNILPIPALDGGRLMFLLVEAFFGKKLAAKRENLVNQIGMILLLGLIFLVTFNDLKKILTR
ncbi:site-2 protease family protein [Candidatus Microgenomates bacterium]|nr:site-2 protease family protein [Candidatus Microgenomates bacterium]